MFRKYTEFMDSFFSLKNPQCDTVRNLYTPHKIKYQDLWPVLTKQTFPLPLVVLDLVDELPGANLQLVLCLLFLQDGG